MVGDWLIADPQRIVGICALGVDETKVRAGTKDRRTSWVTVVCYVTRRFVADVVEGRDGSVVEAWVDAREPEVTCDVRLVASDMSSSYGECCARSSLTRSMWWTGFVWSRPRTARSTKPGEECDKK